MSALRLRAHNQGDVAREADGYDIACLSERSHHTPGNVERYTSRLLKGLAIDWDPDVFEVHRTKAHVAHPPIPKRSPRRGTLVARGVWLPTGTKVAVMAAHRINDPRGLKRAFPRLTRACWMRHAAMDRRIAERLIAAGYVVLYGADVNDHTATLTPLVRAPRTLGRYDAIGYSGARLVSCEAGSSGGSDHAAFTAIFDIKEKP